MLEMCVCVNAGRCLQKQKKRRETWGGGLMLKRDDENSDDEVMPLRARSRHTGQLSTVSCTCSRSLSLFT